MHDTDKEASSPTPNARLEPAAKRALEEAAQRRAQRQDSTPAPETQGRGGLEPVRYGDWEVNGLATDF